MPAWFSRVFKTQGALPQQTGGDVGYTAVEETPGPEYEPPRAVVNAPVLAGEEAQSNWSDEIRIKARIDHNDASCTLMVDRPVLEVHSFWAPDRDTANARSPLAASIFDLGGVASVLLHRMTVTIARDASSSQTWEDFVKAAGAQVRAHLKSGMPVVDPAYMDRIPTEEEIRARLQAVLDQEINPGIASHSGVITLNRVEGNTAYITMGGGCQGCAASTITLRGGIHAAFREAVPEVGAILDETDHAAGTNPYFREIPAGMEG